ncbi:MAG: nucleoside deaminase [Chitinophagales bacterium]
MLLTDEYFMRIALQQAQLAFEADEIPVGAIIVANNTIIAKAHNQVEQLQDVTAHAEILAMTAASSYLGSKYLKDCTLYVSLEPCTMCGGAIYWGQLGRLVFGAWDEKRGCESLNLKALHPKTQVKGGVLGGESSQMIRLFFEQKRL